METKVWKPSKFLDSTNFEYLDEHYGVVVLNRPINLEPMHTKQLWEKGSSNIKRSITDIIHLQFTAKCRCLVDGGANRWLDFLDKYSELGVFENPELITGDFDSITDQTMAFFRQLSTPTIIHTPNEDFTDFTKSLMELSPYIRKENVSDKFFVFKIQF